MGLDKNRKVCYTMDMKNKPAAKTAAHTPGPWSIQPIGDETEANVLGAARELIATVSDNDARLIAAAPELLSALKRVVEDHEAELMERGLPMLAGHRGGIALARAALKLAQEVK